MNKTVVIVTSRMKPTALGLEEHELMRLLSVLGAVDAATKHQYHRIIPLLEGQLTLDAGVVRERVTRKLCSWLNIFLHD